MPRLFASRGVKTSAERDFPDASRWHRKGVCRRCGLIVNDTEPMCRAGLFYHLAKPHQTRALCCPNNDKTLTTEDRDLVPFMRKGQRRRNKRNGIKA